MRSPLLLHVSFVTMSDFTDNEDRQLVQLARDFLRHSQQIPWEQLVRQMKGSKKTKEALRQRLKTLKRKHGLNLENFPAWFFPSKFSTGQTSSRLNIIRQRVEKNHGAKDADLPCSPAKIRTEPENSPATSLSPQSLECQPEMKPEPPASLLLLASVASTEGHQEEQTTNRRTCTSEEFTVLL